MANKPGPTSRLGRKDFTRIQKEGSRFHAAPWLMVNFMANQTEQFGVGWTLPRYVGSAVLRNRIRRWGRETVKDVLRREPRLIGWDVNFVFKRQPKEQYESLRREEFDRRLQSALNRVADRSRR